MNNNLSIPYLMECVGQVRKLTGGVTTICAGGAIRDLICGKPVKDLDFFIEDPDFDYDHMVDKVSDYFGCNLRSKWDKDHKLVELAPQLSCLQGGGGYGKEDSGIRVFEIKPGFRSYPVQLIFHMEDDVREEAEHGFDFGICRAWCDDRRLRLTSAFHEDRDNQRLTLYHSTGPRQTKQDRIDRLREKFAGWKFRDLRKRAPLVNSVYTEIQVERLPELV